MATLPEELTREIATIARDINRTTYGGVLQNTDDTLLTRGGAAGLKIYDNIERDTHAFAVLQKRKLAVAAREWRVDAASEDARDTQAAEIARRALNDEQFDVLTVGLLDAILKGFAVAEVMWQVVDNLILPASFIMRDQRRFVFADGEREGFDLRLLTREAPFKGEPLPQRKFIVHRSGAKDGSPYGLGLGTRLFWPVLFKRQDITFWLTFADKFGSPTAVGKYPNGAPKAEQDKLLAALDALAQDGRIAVG